MLAAYFVKIDATDNHNRYYKMSQNSPNSFQVEIGRVGVRPVVKTYALSAWDGLYQKKIKEGYVERTDLSLPSSSQTYAEIQDPLVRDLICFLQKESNMAIQESYNISFLEVTEAMITEAENLLSCFSNDMEEDNALLCRLFAVIPRKMEDVKENLIKSPEDIYKVLQREQELLDALRTKVQTSKGNPQKTLLESWDTSITPVTSERELEQIKKFMKQNSCQFVRAFRVRNKKKDDAFWKNYERKGYAKDDIHYYYHGSRNMNCLSILKNGLILNPKAPRTGSMFGHGIYLAPKAQKSIGYTSLQGSHWAKGNSDRAYLFVMKCVYQNPLHVYQWSSEMSQYTQKKIAPHDAVYAHAGVSLLNDEIVIFNDAQATLQYIIELEERK